MTSRTAILRGQVRVPEGSTCRYRSQIVDGFGNPIDGNSVVAAKMWLKNVSVEPATVINNRDDQDIHNAHNVVFSAPINITDITYTERLQITIPAHGLLTGFYVFLTGTGHPEINDRTYEVIRESEDVISISVNGLDLIPAPVSGIARTGMMVWEAQPEDNVIGGADVANGTVELHEATFKITTNGGDVIVDTVIVEVVQVEAF